MDKGKLTPAAPRALNGGSNETAVPSPTAPTGAVKAQAGVALNGGPCGIANTSGGTMNPVGTMGQDQGPQGK